jgi:hypothetical protein
MSEYLEATGQHNYYKVVYDGDGQRIHTVEEENADSPGRVYYERIYLFKEKIYYEINLSTNECKKLALHTPWSGREIPKNATFDREHVMGSITNGLKVQEWSDRVTYASESLMWGGTFTAVDCLPVTTVVIETQQQKTYLSSTEDYYDIDTSPLNPNAFIPPAECPKAFN